VSVQIRRRDADLAHEREEARKDREILENAQSENVQQRP
jgi:hypothetical protein